MKATVTAKGQITIPLKIRQKFHLEVGDQIDFDESGPVLTARRVGERS
jgi:AbrB family looped-hinge helix DNA binding protein